MNFECKYFNIHGYVFTITTDTMLHYKTYPKAIAMLNEMNGFLKEIGLDNASGLEFVICNKDCQIKLLDRESQERYIIYNGYKFDCSDNLFITEEE